MCIKGTCGTWKIKRNKNKNNQIQGVLEKIDDTKGKKGG